MRKRPNIILIFTDNQQASTLGCYGNSEVYTPHLDALSTGGVTFDNAFCPNAFCSPCRASVLTGMLPSQHGVHSWIDDRKSHTWPDGWHALDGLRTMPKALKDEGYATALIGKYHLGESHTPAEGFDHWVTLKDGHVRSFYNNKIFDNGKVYDHSGHSVDFFTDKARDFLATQQDVDDPFFLFLPYPAPYGHWPATKEDIACRHTDRYADCPMESIPRQGLSKKAVDGFLLNREWSSKSLDLSMLMRAPNDLATLRNYYAQVSMVDDGVGAIVQTLADQGIADDTLVIFTTDHGLSVGHHGFWGHGGACFPSNLHHAAHSVPMIVHQAGTIAAGVRCATMVSNLDLFATILAHASADAPNADVPSRDLSPLLRGENPADWGEDVVFSEQEETRVLRTPKWAFFRRFDQSDEQLMQNELYDVVSDPTETINLSGEPAYADLEQSFVQMIDDFFAKHSCPQADLWQGETPLQNSIRQSFWRSVWGEDWSPTFSHNDE